MINCKNASERLKTSPEMLKKRFEKLGVNENMKRHDLSVEEEIELVKYLNQYIVKFTVDDLERLQNEHLYMHEVLLRLTCLSGNIDNMEPIWIILKIVKNKDQQIC